MLQSTTDHHPTNGTTHPGSLAAHYAPGQERPLGPYALLAGVYGTGFVGSLLALRARSISFPSAPPRQTCCSSPFLQVAYRAAKDQL
jgi:hypothetical protein